MPFDYGYIPDGYIPDEDMPEAAAAFDALAGKYDADGTPNIVTWESFRPTVEQMAVETEAMSRAGYLIQWWKIAEHLGIPVWQSNQSRLGSCAGWSAGNGDMVSDLYQMFLGAFIFEPKNPVAMWYVTKNWSSRGGQSMSNVMMGGNKYGNFPSRIVGTDPINVNRRAVLDAASEASRFQIGAARLPGSGKALADAIVLCLQARRPVCIGNSVAVASSQVNGKGLRQATLGGSWSHATLFDSYAVVDGEIWIGWMNSHGNNRYGGSDRLGKPGNGCWMNGNQLVRFCSSRYVDAFVITYSEAAVDRSRRTLSPLPIFET